MNQQNILRIISVLVGGVILLFGIGFGLDMAWATSTWPWPDGPLSYLFIGAILAAVAVDFIWIGISATWSAFPGAAITGLVMTTGQAIFFCLLTGQPNRQGLLLYALWFGVVDLISLGLFVWGRRFPVPDAGPTPHLVRISYIIFAVTLFLAASALILQVQIFPWKLNPDSAVMYGWIFMGNAAYFLYALLRPGWHNARGQLISFLAYDLVLILPFLGLFAAPSTNLPSLIIYTLILCYSGLLSVYYLFIAPATRFGAVTQKQQN